MKLLASLALALSLTACASQPRVDSRDQRFQEHLADLDQLVQAGKMTRSQAAANAKLEANALFNDPYMDELWAYRVMLASQVENGQRTMEEASYLDQRKINEIMEKVKQSPSSRRIFKPYVNCRQDGLGNTRCQ